jgi:tRNA A-37 threonylcarbamoyl transferase component Bud32
LPSELADRHKSSPGPVRDAVSSGRFRWSFAPASPDLVRAIQEIPWETLKSFPLASRVKVAENRDVWRIDLPGRTIYAKCYRSQGFLKRIVERVRGLAAKREWQALRQAAAIGVLAPEALAYATASSARGAYTALLITAAMPADALSLEQAWLAAQEPAEAGVVRRRKGRLIAGLAELISRAHAGGLFHHDLHVGNILIFPHNGTVTAAMIDLHNARLSKGLCLSGVRSNLVQLNQWFGRHASRTERLRFLKLYCRQLRERSAIRAGSGAAERYGYRSLARYVLKVSRRYAARLHAKRDRRILKQNKYFSMVGLSGGWSGRIALDVKHGRPYEHALHDLPDKQGWRGMIADPPALLAGEAVRVLKSSASRRVVQVDLKFGESSWAVVAKHERRGTVLQRLLARFGRNALRQEFVTGWKCLHRELPVALPLAILSREGSWRQESILLVEYIPDSRDLDTFTKLHLPEMAAAQALRLKRRVCGELARTLRRMWVCNLAHRDLKAANIRLQIPQGDIEKVRIVLVDVDGIRRPAWGLRKALLRSLARLDASFAGTPVVTRTDRLRLLLAVLRGIDGGQPRWKDAWRRIGRLSLRDQATIAKALPWLQPIGSAAGAE